MFVSDEKRMKKVSKSRVLGVVQKQRNSSFLCVKIFAPEVCKLQDRQTFVCRSGNLQTSGVTHRVTWSRSYVQKIFVQFTGPTNESLSVLQICKFLVKMFYT